jgi:glycosidase
LNQGNAAVAQYLTQNAVWWIEQAGLDGLRLDTFPYVGREFWKEFHGEIHGLYPRVTTVSEVFNPDATITSAFAGGVTRNGVDTGLDTPFDFPTYFGLRDVLLHGAPMSKLTDVWRLDALYPHPERLVPFEGNHDTPRFLGEAGATPAKLKLAFAILATMRGMPQIYSGDEIGMMGGEDPDNRRDFPGGFGGGAENAFVAGTRTPVQAEMHDWVKGLLDMRRANGTLQTGEQQVLQADTDTMAYVRGRNLRWGCTAGAGKGRVLVVVNKGDNPETLDLPMSHTALAECRKTSALWGAEGGVEIKGDMLHVVVSPGSVEIMSVN